jgi:hypothetical protein
MWAPLGHSKESLPRGGVADKAEDSIAVSECIAKVLGSVNQSGDDDSVANDTIGDQIIMDAPEAIGPDFTVRTAVPCTWKFSQQVMAAWRSSRT